ncbi:inosine triphosphate pyrophosphatase-like protein [Suillus lakei]|nr:inosine triphosphate pyrophosphatase-like protein [Suillus lakei]
MTRVSRLPYYIATFSTVAMASKRLTFVTGNHNKLKETKYILSQGTPIEIDSQDLDIPELQGTTQEVAIAKCRRAAELLGKSCITEDTALCFVAYNGLPGPYIKHFLKTLGHEGLNNMLVGFPTKDAYALCTFAYSAGPGTEPTLFEGRTEGTIVHARGPGDFGWDSVFQPKGFDQTYAEMTKEQKNIISHRYRALDKLRAYLVTLDTENS